MSSGPREEDEDFAFEIDEDGADAPDLDEDDGAAMYLDEDPADDPDDDGDAAALIEGDDSAPTAAPSGDGIDLTPDQRIAIDVAAEGLDKKSFYEVLLLPRTADVRAIKRSYYRLSKEYHPDKFYRKRLGPYKDKLELLFGKINEAYRVLSDAAAREDYDVLVFGKDGKDVASGAESTLEVNFVPESARLKEAARKAKETAAEPKKRPVGQAKFLQDFQGQLAQRVAKARRHIKAGEEAAEKGDAGEAARHFQAALMLDPRNVRAKSMYNRMVAQDRNARAEEFFRQAQEALLAEDQKRAATLMAKAVDCKPTRGKYYHDFGKLIGANTMQQKTALELLRKAVELENRNVEYTMDLARAYEDVGMPTNAARAYERVLQLDKTRADAAKALKKLK